ncbi:hypothetical protein KUL113_65220 [Tenacibaculum sp. KUL113]|nr:hypothetical protein KUL113_65220 [Tenacibaculum sp. KUL113]
MGYTLKNSNMRITVLFLLAIMLFSCESIIQKEQSKPKKIALKEDLKKGKISILGTFHFANTTDYSAIIIEDLNSSKRQLELKKLVENLAKFKPTKILVEREPILTDSLSKKLIDFKKGKYDLPNNELYQIGFRLAKKLNLNKIYGIDYHLELGDTELIEYLNEKKLMEEFANTLKSAKVWASKETEYLKTHTLGESLANLNTSESDNFNRNLYLDGILNISKNGNSPASDYVSNWYKRNIYIKKNIDDLINENDRVLVIIGAGHSAILKDFYRSSKNTEYVDLTNIGEK